MLKFFRGFIDLKKLVGTLKLKENLDVLRQNVPQELPNHGINHHNKVV